jgi:5'-3' exonuclease
VEGNHIGGVFHFINTLRKQIDEHNYDKIIVFWDGDDNSAVRRKLYPNYKLNRRQSMNEFKLESYHIQKERVKEYLEECFVRQVRATECEADDLIAFYCQIAKEESKTILSADKDYFQLIDKHTSIYSPISKVTFKNGDKVKFGDTEFPHYNVLTLKILTGDKSDNIEGISLLGEKTLVKFFPEILEKEISYNDILTRAEDLLKEQKDNQTLKNLLTGKTKSGIFEKEFFQVNEQIVDLDNPLLTDEDKEEILSIVTEKLDIEGRSYKNLIKYMVEDGLFKYLPKGDDAWTYFIQPFMKLTRKEKTKTNKQ